MGIAYNTSIVRDGLILHLDAANVKSYPGANTTWYDISGNDNHATLVNGPSFDGSSVSFDGSNDASISEVSPDITGNSPWTISIWANVNSSEVGVGRKGYMIWKGQQFQTANQLIAMGVNNGSIEIAHWSNDTVYTNAPVSFDSWSMYACTFDGTTERVYVNGIELGVKTTSLSVISGSWYLASRTSVTEYLNVKISSFQIYNRAISDTEVKKNFEALRGRYGI
jgi:hypothetical protein